MIIWKCVPPNELERHTRDGWHLEQILVAMKPTTIQHSAPAQVVNNNNNNGYQSYQSGMTVPVDSPVVVQEPMFLLKKDAEVESRESELIASVETHRKLLKEAEARLPPIERERDQYKDEADRRTKELNLAAAQQIKDIEAKRKLEGDLSKIQKAIGDIEYFKIVGAK
jgi:hypothetical protein